MKNVFFFTNKKNERTFRKKELFPLAFIKERKKRKKERKKERKKVFPFFFFTEMKTKRKKDREGKKGTQRTSLP